MIKPQQRANIVEHYSYGSNAQGAAALIEHSHYSYKHDSQACATVNYPQAIPPPSSLMSQNLEAAPLCCIEELYLTGYTTATSIPPSNIPDGQPCT